MSFISTLNTKNIKCNKNNRDAMIYVIKTNENVIKLNNLKNKEEDCSICFDKLDGSRMILECGHMYCIECFTNHSRLNNKCPLCRDTFGKKPIVREQMDMLIMDNILDNYMQNISNLSLIDDYATKIKCDGVEEAEPFIREIIIKSCKDLGVNISKWYLES